ncbi:thioredoxin domain-containing protein 17-like [Onthophagus taurus]|uniref:thioredoxin domain-containing protein 17-like n=1 Tax=Onthophagus taurus TaxID=166361 RepID=UPI0039BE33E7
MVIRHHVQGYENFCKFMEEFKADGQLIHVYFSGNKLPNGESWCDDCVRALPVIEAGLSQAPENSHFIYVEVGDRPTWKDPKCPFRTDKKTNLMVLPTLLRWNSPQKLQGDQCEKPELVEMLFTDE